MRALSSGHSLHSPLVAFFCCYLIHTTRGANIPRSRTVIWRRLSSNAVWLSASTVSSQREVTMKTVWTQDRSHRESQQGPGGPVSADSSAKLMENKRLPLVPDRAELRARPQRRVPHRPRHPREPPAHHFPDPGLHSRAKAEAKVKWAELLRAKEIQRQQAQRERRRRDQVCTTTHFPKHTVSFLGNAGFSPRVSVPCAGVDCMTGASRVSPSNRPNAAHMDDQTKGSAVKMIQAEQDGGLNTQVWRTDNKNDRKRYSESGHRQTENKGSRVHVENTRKHRSEVSGLAHRPQHELSAVVYHGDPVGGHAERVVRAQGGTLRADSTRGVQGIVERVDRPAGRSLARGDWDAEDAGERGVGDVTRHVGHTTGTRPKVHHASPSRYKISRSTHPHSSTFRHHRHRLARRSAERSCQVEHCPFYDVQPPGPRRPKGPQSSVRDVQPVQRSSVGAMSHTDDLSSKESVSMSPHPGELGLGVIRNTANGAAADPHASIRDQKTGVHFGRAVYFSGQEVMRLKSPALVSPGRSLPAHNFTVEMWLKPEGGQYDPAVIAGEYLHPVYISFYLHVCGH